MIINCPNCQQRLLAPEGRAVRLRCPICKEVFDYVPTARRVPSSKKLKSLTRSLSTLWQGGRMRWALAVVGLIGVVIITNRYGSESAGTHVSYKAPHKVQENWITVAYRDLLDNNAIVRTGGKLVDSLPDPGLRGAIQPFVDKYSNLLQHAVELLKGPDAHPHHNVVDHYPVGSPQPAWVAILRGGRICVTTDNQNHARVFLPGDSPEDAYRTQYSIVRHCLNSLVPSDGTNLNIEVYAYHHDYSRSELEFNDRPYVFAASSFPAPDKTPLDLEGLEAFFRNGGQLEGIQLDAQEGLILFSREGGRPTAAGFPISLADFAVAYRAVFHAGDNEAFISLDPHTDPTLTTVNFGGFLEDTRIGYVVLESDKRFKTITSGLDPNTQKDIRNRTRQLMPAFLTSNEREFLSSDPEGRNGWVGTRFWFYPDSIEVEADGAMRYGRVVNPQFLADAERSRDDFSSPQEFELKKKNTLLPSIRDCIEQLNTNYQSYASAYPEIRELATVARLMGICSWLTRADTHNVDLDALLSIELPAFRTEKERTQLLTAAYIAFSDHHPLTIEYIKENMQIINLSPILDMAVRDYFKNAENVARYISNRKSETVSSSLNCNEQAGQFFQDNQDAKVRAIIKTKEDLQALATYATSRIKVRTPGAVAREDEQLQSMKDELENLKNRMDWLDTKADRSDSALEANIYINQYNVLVGRYELQRQTYNWLIAEFNKKAPNQVQTLMRISGGINLEPKYFKIRNAPDSPTLRRFVDLCPSARPDWTPIPNEGRWIRSRSGRGSEFHVSLSRCLWETKDVSLAGDVEYRYSRGSGSQQSWYAASKVPGTWRYGVLYENGLLQQKTLVTPNRLVIVDSDTKQNRSVSITCEMEGKNRIIFRKSTTDEFNKPAIPPVWWKERQSQEARH